MTEPSDFAAAWRSLTARHAERSALRFGARTLTYAELARHVAVLAAELERYRGRAFWFAPRNDPPSVALILAAFSAGAVPVLADPVWTDNEREKIRARDGVDLFISCAGGVLEAMDRAPLDLSRFVVHDEARGGAPRLLSGTILGRFTSGSTSLPRCLQFPWSAVHAAASGWQRAVGLDVGDRVLCLATLNNGLGFNTSFLSVFLVGAELGLLPAQRLLPSAIHRALADGGSTVLVAFPFAFDLLMRAGRDLPTSIRAAVSSAAKLDAVTQRYFFQRGTPICNYYGLAEAGPVTCNLDGDAESLGRPLSHAELLITDDGGSVRPRGESGVLRVKTTSMAVDYLDADSPTFSARLDERGYYVTSDRARFDGEGRLCLLGRVDALVNVNGRKIEPLEVETAIRELAEVSAVIVRGEERLGKTALVAYVESGGLSEQAVLRHCAERLAGYKVPHIVHLVRAFPRSSSGKISIGQMRLVSEEVSGC